MSPKDTILKLLPSLNEKEIAEIVGLLALLKTKKKPTLATASSERWFEAIAGVLGIRLGYAGAVKTAAGRNLKAATASAEDFMNSIITEKVTRELGRSAIRKFLVELLVADMKRRGLSPTWGMVVTGLQRLPDVVDAAFPGYRSAGLTHLIFDRFGKKGD